MRLLLVNDDGIDSEGIQSLAREIEKEHELIIVAPSDEKSAQSQALTLKKPLVVKEIELVGIKSKTYSVSGTPADCVRVAIDSLIEEPVDLVLSGINRGLNVGMDVLYSGTVSAAIEANLYKIPSIALSAQWENGKINYDITVEYGRYIIERIKDELIDKNMIISINTPYVEDKDQVKGIKVCKVGGIVYDSYIMEDGKIKDERIIKTNGRIRKIDEDDTDRYYVSQNYVTITPLQYDLTNFELIDKVASWL